MKARPPLPALAVPGALSLLLLMLPAAAQGIVPPPAPDASQASALPHGQVQAGDAIRNIYSLPQADGFRRLIELSADGGVPQPTEWRAISHDPNSPTLLHAWWADAGSASDEGQPDIPYSQDPPSGFVNLDRWNIDSSRAFSIAEAAAVEAGIGFDSADYTLRAQEITNEPLWIIGLNTRRGNRVGTVYLSAETGQVKRTIWIDSSLRRRGFSGIEDSALNAQPPATPQLPPVSPPTPAPPVPSSGGVSIDPGAATPGFNPAIPSTTPSRTPGQSPRPDPRATVPRGGEGNSAATPAPPPPAAGPTPPATPPADTGGLLPGEVPAVNR